MRKYIEPRQQLTDSRRLSLQFVGCATKAFTSHLAKACITSHLAKACMQAVHTLMSTTHGKQARACILVVVRLVKCAQP